MMLMCEKVTLRLTIDTMDEQTLQDFHLNF